MKIKINIIIFGRLGTKNSEEMHINSYFFNLYFDSFSFPIINLTETLLHSI